MTDKQLDDILKSIVILVDTREQKNDHIIDFFKANNIKYEYQKLNVGDYSFRVDKLPELNGELIATVERKNSLDEICGNFTASRERFVREFERSLESGVNVHLMIENATWKKIFGKSYRSMLPAKSFVASLLTFSIRYSLQVWFLTPSEAGAFILNVLVYELREYLKEYKA